MRQRGNSWELRVFLGHDPLTGNKPYATQTVRGGKRAAQSKLAEMVTEAERGLTARTTATVGQLLETWFELASPDFSPKTVRETRGPAVATTPPRVPASDIKPPAPADLARVLRRAGEESPDLACYLVLAADTGARRSEMIALRWADIDLDAATVSIERGIVLGPDGLVEKGTKTHSARRVSLDAGTVGVLVDHRERSRERAEACGVESARTVAGRLGHRNAATTLNVHAHFVEESDRAAADIIARCCNARAEQGRDPAISQRSVSPSRSCPLANTVTESNSVSIARSGTTIRRPRRSDGMEPRRTHSYALEREMPSAVAAWVTVIVAGLGVVLMVLSVGPGSFVASSLAEVKAAVD